MDRTRPVKSDRSIRRLLLIAGGLVWIFSLLVDVTRYGRDLTVSMREGAIKFYWGDDPNTPGRRNGTIALGYQWPTEYISPHNESDFAGEWKLGRGVLFRFEQFDIDPCDNRTVGTYFGVGLPRYSDNPCSDSSGRVLAVPVWLPFVAVWLALRWRARDCRRRSRIGSSTFTGRLLRKAVRPVIALWLVSLAYEFEYFGSRLSFGLGRGMIRFAWDGSVNASDQYIPRTLHFNEFEPWPRNQGEPGFGFSGGWPEPGYLYVCDAITLALDYSHDARNERIPLFGFRWPMIRYVQGNVGVYLPLWPFAATMALAWFIRRRRDRLRTGYCIDCGYDLTGNVSGRCSECGTIIGASTPRA